MKKIFLLAGIVAFSFASAQQNDIFDIQKYLEKKSMDEKKAITKPLSKILKPSNETSDQKFWTLPNGNKVYSLPQDNMPCVVPDMTVFNMPVVKVEIIPNAIPNPANPPQNINADKLKELLKKTAK